MQAVSIKSLRKVYLNNTVAIENMDLTIETGNFFALVGRNGAGKSTLINILSSLTQKTSGSVRVFGHDLDQDPQAVKSHIGLVPQEFNFSIFEKVSDILITRAGYYGVPVKTAKKRADYFLEKLGLWEHRNKIGMQLSGGMKRRLMIISALLHQQRLLILDEPTAGVDIDLRHGLWDFLNDLNQQGTTIILTTHYLEEAEKLCKDIAIIDQGRIVENTEMQTLLKKPSTETFVFTLKSPIQPSLPESIFTLNYIDAEHIEVDLKQEQTLNQLFDFFRQHSIDVSSMRNKANRLETLFLHLTRSESLSTH